MGTRFTFKTLYNHHKKLFDELVYPIHLEDTTSELIEFWEDQHPAFEGYRVKKGGIRYVLPSRVKQPGTGFVDVASLMPIKIKGDCERVFIKGARKYAVHVVEPQHIIPFRIVPDKQMDFASLIDAVDFKHSVPLEYTLWKIIALTARCSRIHVCLSTNPAWGKSSIVSVFHDVFDRMMPLDAPKTQAALAKGISSDGVMVLDECAKLGADAANFISPVLFQVAGHNPRLNYSTAGSAEYKTKGTFDIGELSSIILYNRFGKEYTEQKHFFDWMFPNKEALNSRYLRLKPSDGELDTAQFRGVDTTLRDEDTQLFVSMAKSMCYYQEQWRSELKDELSDEDRAFLVECVTNQPHISGSRHKASLQAIAEGIMLYVRKDMSAFSQYFSIVLQWYKNYHHMVHPATGSLEGYDEQLI